MDTVGVVLTGRETDCYSLHEEYRLEILDMMICRKIQIYI